MKSSEGFVRMRTLQGVVLFIFLLIAGRLAYIQLVDSKYNELAKANVLRHVVQYPPRGEVFDRNGEYLVQSRECYDLMVIYSEIDKHGFDTLRMCDVLGLSRGKLEKELANARMRPRAPRVVTNYISKEDKLRFDECNFRGFYTVYRTVRRYPRKIGGNLLGYVSEVNADYLKRNPEYKIGDYVGMGGVESAYEPLLRGTKGVKIQEIDTHGAIKGSYMNGVYDSLPEPGKYIVSTIDARLQLLGEELMRGKVGAAVAIEPSTGEILMMVSSPTYDPDELVGRERGNNYMKMLGNKRQPLYNRAVRAKYPPGSTFKLDPQALTLYTNVPGANGIVLRDDVMYVASYPPDGVTTDKNVIYEIGDIRMPHPAPLTDRAGQYDGLALSGDGQRLYFTSWVNGEVGYWDFQNRSVQLLDLADVELSGPARIALRDGVLYIPDLPASRIVIVR